MTDMIIFRIKIRKDISSFHDKEYENASMRYRSDQSWWEDLKSMKSNLSIVVSRLRNFRIMTIGSNTNLIIFQNYHM